MAISTKYISLDYKDPERGNSPTHPGFPADFARIEGSVSLLDPHGVSDHYMGGGSSNFGS